MASKIVLNNNLDSEFTIQHSDNTGAKTIASKDMAQAVDTINDFPTNPHTGQVVIVRDLDRGGTFIYDATKVSESNDGTNFSGWVRQYSGAVYAEWFGAVGDGVTDDTVAVRNCHTHANEVNKKVKYHMYNVLLQANAQIIINTDVDFNGCKISVVGGINITPSFATINTLFIIKDETISPLVVVIPPSSLAKGTASVVLPETATSGLLLLETNKPIGTRVGYPEVELFYKQTFEVNRGVLNFPLMVDLTAYSNTATFYQDSTRGYLTISGLTTNDLTYNNQTIIRILRNNVIFEKNNIIPAQNTGISSINYIVSCNRCCNVVLRDSKVTAQWSNSTASYGINLEEVANIKLLNLSATGDNSWGVTGSNHVNGLTVRDSDMNRIDVHSGMHNVDVSGCSLVTTGVSYGWGSGFIRVSNTTMKTPNTIVSVRGDYFGTFFGDISVQDIVVYSIGVNSPAAIVNLSNIGGSGGIGTLDIVFSVTIRNVRYIHNDIIDSLVVTPIQISKRDGLLDAVRFVDKIYIDNIYSKYKIGFVLNTKLYSYINSASGKCLIDIKNIDCFPYSTLPMIYDSGAVITSYPIDKILLSLNFTNVTGITIWSVIPNAIINIDNSSVSCIRNYGGGSSNQDVSIRNSKIINTISLGGASVGIVCDGSPLNINSTIVSSTCVLTTAKYLSGVAIKSGVTATLPTTVTNTQALQGWVSSGTYLT